MRIKQVVKSESGAVQMVEASFIYPITFMCIFFLIYLGLYILHGITVSSYAQKVAILAARDVAYPGYLDLTASTDVYKSAAIDADFGTSDIEDENGAIVKCTFDTEKVNVDAYRYWRQNPLNEKDKSDLEDILNGNNGLVKNKALFSSGDTNVNVYCDNNIISQNIYVTVEQQLMGVGVLSYFGIDAPKVSAKAVATVSDSDELVRNTDFVFQTMESLAERFGVNVEKIKETVSKAKQTLNLE